MKRSTHTAFTLIELLVVVAIITTLIAILLPSLNRAIEAAENAVCASNQKQIANGQITYAASNVGALPRLIETAGSVNLYMWGRDDSAPFVENELANQIDVLYCPSFLSQNTATTFGAPASDADGYGPGDPAYWYNSMGGWGVANQITTAYFTMTADHLENPVWSLDGKNYRVTSLSTGKADSALLADNQLRRGAQIWSDWTRSHFGNDKPVGSNVTHLDASVRWKSFDEMMLMYSYSFGNRDLFW